MAPTPPEKIATPIEIEIEIVYNMFRMRWLLSLGPPNNAIQGTYKSRLDQYPPKSNLSERWWGVLLLLWDCAVRGGGNVQLGACVCVLCGVAASGCAGFDAVYEKEMMQPLESVGMELCDDA
jgi:hypothetical protein